MRILVGAALLLISTSALAEPSALLKCDGYGGRRGGGESAVRALAIIATMGIAGSPELDQPTARRSGQEGLNACLEALGDERVTGNPIRRGEVLLATALDQLQLDQAGAALATTQQIRALPIAEAQQRAFNRTIGASSLIVAALAEVKLGKQAEANRYAVAVLTLRPYGPLLAASAREILSLSPEISAEEAAALETQVRMAAQYLPLRARRRMMVHDFAGAAADLQSHIALFGPTYPDYANDATLAVLLAVLGRSAEAEAVLAQYQEHSGLAAATAAGNAETTARLQLGDEQVRLARIQLAINAGQLPAAQALLAAQPRWLALPEMVAAVMTSARAHGLQADDPQLLLQNLRQSQMKTVTDVIAAGGLTTWLPRWESAETWAADERIASDPKMSRADVSLPGKIGRHLTTIYPAAGFIDSVSEATLVALARQVRATGEANFAIVSSIQTWNGKLVPPAVGRAGREANAQVFYYLLPGDKGYAAIAGHAFAVADIERDLGAFYPPPAAAGR